MFRAEHSAMPANGGTWATPYTRRNTRRGDNQNGGRYPGMFENGNTSGFSSIPIASFRKARLR
jgi:hypothetical protein